jgi:hypothetical protein
MSNGGAPLIVVLFALAAVIVGAAVVAYARRDDAPRAPRRPNGPGGGASA